MFLLTLLEMFELIPEGCFYIHLLTGYSFTVLTLNSNVISLENTYLVGEVRLFVFVALCYFFVLFVDCNLFPFFFFFFKYLKLQLKVPKVKST